MSKLELTIIEVENGYRIIEGGRYEEVNRHGEFPKEHVAANIAKLAEIVTKLAEDKHPQPGNEKAEK